MGRLYVAIAFSLSIPKMLINHEIDTSLLALLAFIGSVTCSAIQRFQFSAGRHTWDQPLENYNGYPRVSILGLSATIQLSPSLTSIQTAAVNRLLYILGIMLAKLSLLIFFYRIFKVDSRFRLAAWLLGTLLVTWSTVSVLLNLFACRPLRGPWDVNMILGGRVHCAVQVYNTVNVQGVCNIITDFALLLLPIPMLWKLQMSTKKKFGVSLVFATGAL